MLLEDVSSASGGRSAEQRDCTEREIVASPMGSPFHGRLVATALAAVLVSMGAGTDASARQPARSAALEWRDCGEGFQCATARVPRDYRRPTGAKISLDVVRLPAMDPTKRIGSLFMNPGGPGASGVELVERRTGPGCSLRSTDASTSSAGTRAGWAPSTARWTKRSAGCMPSLCRCQPASRCGGSSVARGATCGAACAGRHGGSFRICTPRTWHVTSIVCGRPWATTRSATSATPTGPTSEPTYATLFPRRVRALVLDGAVDVEGYIRDPIGDIRLQTAGYEDAFDRFVAACRIRPDHCGLGTSPRAGWQALVKRLDRRSIPVPGASFTAAGRRGRPARGHLGTFNRGAPGLCSATR